MGIVRSVVDTDPGRALAVVDTLERDYPSGRFADERSFLKMRALVHENRIGDARAEARAFHERHPGSPFAREVWQLTGVRPMPQPPRR